MDLSDFFEYFPGWFVFFYLMATDIVPSARWHWRYGRRGAGRNG